MELSAEQLAEIEDFAYKYLEKKEIAMIVGFTWCEFILDDEEHPAYMAFWRGRLKRKAQFNQNVIQLSDQLSSPAQNIESKLAETIYLNDKKK